MTTKRSIALLMAAVFTGGYLVAYFIHREVTRDRMPAGAPTEAPSGEGWIDLFAEPYAERWTNPDDDVEVFTLTDGTLHILGASVTELRYAAIPDAVWKDFELHIEYKLAPGANSGMFLRWPDTDLHRGFEVQMLDDFGEEPSAIRTGAIYDVVTPMYNMSRPAGEWNSIDVRAVGPLIEVWVNGWKVIDTNLDQLTMPVGKFDVPFAEYAREGYIALQDHQTEAWFRNFYIRPISDQASEAESESGG